MPATESEDAKRIAELEAKANALIDALAKVTAQFDNFRRRSEQEKKALRELNDKILANTIAELEAKVIEVFHTFQKERQT